MNLCRLHIIFCSVPTGNLWGKTRLPFACKVCIIVFVPAGRKSRVIQRSLTYGLPNLVVLEFANLPGSEQSSLCKKSGLRECSVVRSWSSLTHKSQSR